MADGIPTPVRGVVQTSKGEIPDWLPPSPNGQHQGFHCGERMVAALYMPDGTLFQVQCTENGKAIWPPKEPINYVGKFSTGFVYFVQAENGLIKIGFATNVGRRIASLRTMSPLRLTILATLSKDGMKTETAYHARFSRHRQHGEWFSPHPEILAEVERIKSEYPQ